MFLVDTSVWLEVLLDQERAGEARSFLAAGQRRGLAITDFSLHSVGVVLGRLRKLDAYRDFIADAVERTETAIISLGTDDLKELSPLQDRLRLDFDDAYQYLAAQKHGLTLVSFDADFDRTEVGRKTPNEAAKLLAAETDAPEA